MYTNTFSFDERKLPEYHIRDERLCTTIAWPITLTCDVFNKVFSVNHSGADLGFDQRRRSPPCTGVQGMYLLFLKCCIPGHYVVKVCSGG